MVESSSDMSSQRKQHSWLSPIAGAILDCRPTICQLAGAILDCRAAIFL
jgi:hypothetical protein